MPLRYKILVVDDQEDIREVIRMTLEMDGFIVEELDNGQEVENVINRLKPQLILLDVMLGDCDGREICLQLKSKPQTASIPVIIISATHGLHTAHEKNCGADAYLGKPFNIDDLTQIVKEKLYA